jgi:hypothetical protein
MNAKYASRKWIAFLLVLASGVVLTACGKLDGGQFVALVTILAPAYFAADVTQDQLSRRAPTA